MRSLVRLAQRLFAIGGLALWTVWEIAKATTQVARDVVAPSARISPVVLVVPLRCRTRAEAATVSALIALVPGTLPVGVTDEFTLWIHQMYGSDPEQARRDVLDLETRVLRALRSPALEGAA